MNLELMKKFTQSCLGVPLELLAPVAVSGMDTVEALWPLNDKFFQVIHKVRGLPYDDSFSLEADDAIELLVIEGVSADWSSLSAGAWRVLLERQQQSILIALANELEENPAMHIPHGFSAEQVTIFATLFLMHGMELPWLPFDRSDFELPKGSAKASLQSH